MNPQPSSNLGLAMFLLLSILACSTEPKPLTSAPVDPTEDLEGTLAPQTQWSELGGFFPARPGLPDATPGLSLGMPIDEAGRYLESIALGRPVSRELDGHLVHTATLKAPPEVAVAIVSDADKKVVEELQFTMPAAATERALVDGWGIPAGFTLEEDPSYFWSDDTLRIEWVTIAGRSSGMLIYSGPETPDAPAP